MRRPNTSADARGNSRAGLCLLLALGGCYTGLKGDGAGTGSPTASSEGGESGSEGGGDETTGDEPPSVAVPLQPLHRLNRLEYNNTVRDLLGTELRPADAFGLDPEANGFDNMADQLTVSPVLLDSYANAARDVVADALDDRPVFLAHFDPDDLELEGGYPVGALRALSGNAASATLEVTTASDYELVLTAGASVIGTAPAPAVDLEVDGAVIASFTVEGSAATPVAHIHAVTLEAGPHTVRVRPTNFVNEPVGNDSNNVMVAALDVRSVATTSGPGQALVYVCEPQGADDQDCYEQIITTFAFRAWRRPLTGDEQETLLALWSTLQAQGESAEDALRLVMRTVMLSPKFFYRMRTVADADDDQWLDDYVLASRLSYFIWSSMPDARLFEAAADGRLASDEGLSEAVAWMLEDPRSQALVDGFAEQWLSTRRLAGVSPNAELYPEFDEPLRAAMIEESRHFFGDFLSSGAPVGAMIQPEFSHRNDRLAAHYGEAPVGSDSMVRVPAAAGERRGLLMLGAWLTAKSGAEQSAPIRRGLWVSDRLLCAPVPPPPPGIDTELEEPEGEELSVRELLEMHRSDPNCSHCHQLLDVLGIGFQELDGVARLIDEAEIDNLGELPDGRTFEGAAELGELYADSEVFVDCLARKLFIYALGRATHTEDADDLDGVNAALVSGPGDLPALVDAIVHTPAFRSPAPLGYGD